MEDAVRHAFAKAPFIEVLARVDGMAQNTELSMMRNKSLRDRG